MSDCPFWATRLEHPGLGEFIDEYRKFTGRDIDFDEIKLLLSVTVTFDKAKNDVPLH